MNHGLIPYIGGKHRIAHRIVAACRATGADCLVDVFGGSASVTIAAGSVFGKRIYNDIDGDLVNLFRVIAHAGQRQQLLRILRWTPPSRQIFREDADKYLAGGFSFANCDDPVERARRTFYRHLFAFGGKVRTSGMAISTNDEYGIKEVRRYRNVLRKLVRVGQTFRDVLIENGHFSEIITRFGSRPNVVFYADPPYHGTEIYYSRSFRAGEHAFLAEQLASTNAQVVCSYYDTPMIRNLYPAPRWQWMQIEGTKNSSFIKGNKVKTEEFLIIKLA